MNKQKIKEIFANHFMNSGGKPIGLVAVGAQIEAVKIVLHSLPKEQQPEASHMLIMELVIEAKSSLSVETVGYAGETPVVLYPGGSPEIFLDIYQKFTTIIKFLSDNLENLKIGPHLSKKLLRKNLDQMLDMTCERLNQLKNSSDWSSSKDEVTLISSFLNIAMQIILGEETLAKFGEKANFVKQTLQEIKDEVVMPRSDRPQNKPI